MSTAERFPRAFAKSLFRAGYILAIVLFWQASLSPLMSQFGSNVQYFAQVGVNGGSTTSFTINNPSTTETITVDAQLYLLDGTPLADGQVVLGPGATETLSFGDPKAALTSGWAELKSDGAFIATEFFQLSIGGQLKPRVGVLPSAASDEIRFLGFVNPQFTSGLAVSNPSATEESEITIRAKDNAGQEPVPEKTLTLLPLHSEAGFLNEEKFLGPALTNYEGVVEITVNSPAVAAVSLIQEAGTGDVATVSVLTQSHIITEGDPTFNTALGVSALGSNTTGSFNTASGFEALRRNTTGIANTAVGRWALVSNTEGSFNTASGNSALASNTTGSLNTANGVSALVSNTTGERNTASGTSALFSNTTGFANTATGANALTRNTTGIGNTASGNSALSFNTTGSSNTASGAGALLRNTSGNRNTADGHDALHDNTEGSFNTASGDRALRDNTTGSFNTASGDRALRDNTTGSSNTASGANALSSTTTGAGNTASGVGALSSNTTGSSNTGIGSFADVSADNLSNATAIGANAKVDASNKIRLGDANVSVIEAQVNLTVISDKTKKENFQPVDGEEVLSKLRSLEVPSWNLVGQDPEKFRHYGPMAQDFFAAFGKDGVGTIGTAITINSGDLAGILMIAVQRLEERNVELRARVERLEQAARKMD